MRALLLTFYYPPDLSAGSFRAAALAEALVGNGFSEVHVVTTRPNRYATYRASEQPEHTVLEGVRVDRATVSRHSSGILDQSVSFMTFAAGAFRRTRNEKYDLVIATSSRLFTAALGSLIARRAGAPLFLDIRDLFVETVRDLFSDRSWSRPLVPLLSAIERRTVARADHVNLVSPGFIPYFAERYPDLRCSALGNGIDTDLLAYDFSAEDSRNARKVILYAGNIGLGQGLDRFVPEAAARLGDEFEFRIIGDGGRSAELIRSIRERRLHNVSVVAPMSREDLFHEYRRCDYLLVHLHDAPALSRVIPSKLFEYGATGKPILAGVHGQSRAFVEQELINAAVFPPYDVDAFEQGLRRLTGQSCSREGFRRKYARINIMHDMAELAANLARSRDGDPPHDQRIGRRRPPEP